MRKLVTILFAGTLLATFLFPSVSFAQDATGEGSTVLQKIKEKVEAIRSNPKAFIGSVTDKTENSLQIKDVDGKIQQISVGESVDIVKTGKTNTTVKFTDVAIGDYVISMGIPSGNSVLEAKRILLTSPIEEPKRKIIFGKISQVQKKEVVITEANGENDTLTFPRRWKGPEIADLNEGDNVVTVVTTDDGKLTVRTIETFTVGPEETPSQSPEPSSTK